MRAHAHTICYFKNNCIQKCMLNSMPLPMPQTLGPFIQLLILVSGSQSVAHPIQCPKCENSVPSRDLLKFLKNTMLNIHLNLSNEMHQLVLIYIHVIYIYIYRYNIYIYIIFIYKERKISTYLYLSNIIYIFGFRAVTAHETRTLK